MTNVPIPGQSGRSSARSGKAASKGRFYASIAVLVIAAVCVSLLALGEEFTLTPGRTTAFAKSIAALIITFLVVMPAFAVFQYDRRSAGGGWHEPIWRPTTIGTTALLISLVVAVGWHGLRLAIYVARIWAGEL